MYSTDFIEITPTEAEGFTYSLVPRGSALPNWITLVTCATTNTNCNDVNTSGGHSSLFISARELLGSGTGLGFEYTKVIYITVGTYEIPFILEFIPGSGTGQ